MLCRALTYFRGEPDPFKGDVPNQKVRDMAKEALDAVFAAVDLNAAPSSAPLQVMVAEIPNHRLVHQRVP